MVFAVGTLIERLRKEAEEERRRLATRDQAALFRRWMRLGDAPAQAYLNPQGFAYERARMEDENLRPGRFAARQAAAPPPSPLGLQPPTIAGLQSRPGLRELAAGFAPPPVFGTAPTERWGELEEERIREGGIAAREFFGQVEPEQFPELRAFEQLASGARAPSREEMERTLESDLPLEQQQRFWEAFRQSALARQQQAPALGALEFPFHFAGLGAEKGVEAAGAPEEVGLAANITAQLGTGLVGARFLPSALASRLPAGARTAADVAAIAAMSEPRRVPRVPMGAAGRVAAVPETAPPIPAAAEAAPARAVPAGEIQRGVRIRGTHPQTGQAIEGEALTVGQRRISVRTDDAGVTSIVKETAEPIPPAAAPAPPVPEEALPGRIPPQAVDDFEAIPREAIEASARQQPAPIGGAGEQFAAPLRRFDEVAGEVVTRDDPIGQALARVGVSPSLLETSDVGRATVAFGRQRGSAEQLINVTLASAVDVHRTGVARRLPIAIGDDAIATLDNGRRMPWNDLLSTTQFDNELNAAQRAFVDDFRRVVEEAEFLRTQAGLKPRAIKGAAAKEGWYYIPRQVRGIKGMELRRPSSPGLQRHYDEAIEGIENGVRYESDPRAVLDLHLRQAYREIAEKQLSDFLEPLSITAKELVPEGIRNRMVAVVNARLAAERARRALVVSRRLEEVEKGTALRLRGRSVRRPPPEKGFEFKPGKMTPLQRQADARLAAARKEYAVVKNIYGRAMEQARKAELAPGSLFGKAEDVIPVGQWRNRFFPLEDAQRLNDALGAFLQSPRRANWVGRGFEQLGNHIRFLSAIGDFAAPFIQGLPLLGRNPVAWARATFRHYQAFADPGVQARFIRDHIDTFQEMAAHNIPIGDVEFFKAIREGQGVSLGAVLERLPKGTQTRNLLRGVGRQTFGRFQASYDMFLTSARAQLWESMKQGWKGSLDDLAAHVRNMTGGLDSRALGVGPTQRGLESTWLAFSPRLLRSTAALIGDLRLGPVNPRGRAAFQALGGLVAGTVGIYILTGMAMGKSEEEIRTGLNPLKGKKFLSHEINGDWVGVGGQVRAIVQLLTRSAVDPKSLVAPGQFDNPLLQFASGRGAPGMRIAQAVGEQFTGADLLPYDDIDSLPDMFLHIGQSALPFAVQGLLEGEGATAFGTGLAGARTSPQTPGEELTERFEAKFGRPYNWKTDRQIAEQDEELRPLLGRSEERVEREAFVADKEQEVGLPEKAAAVLRGDLAAIAGFNEAYEELRSTAATAAARDFFGTEEREPRTEEERRYSEYYEISPWDQRFEDPETREIDWSLYMEAKDAAFARLPSELQQAIENKTVAQDEGVNRLARQLREWRDELDPYYEIDLEQPRGRTLRENLRRRQQHIDAILWITGSVTSVLSEPAQREAARLLGDELGVRIQVGDVPRRPPTGGGLRPVRPGRPTAPTIRP